MCALGPWAPCVFRTLAASSEHRGGQDLSCEAAQAENWAESKAFGFGGCCLGKGEVVLNGWKKISI